MEPTDILMRLLPKDVADRVGLPPPDAAELRLRANRPIQWRTLTGRCLSGGKLSADMLLHAVFALSEHSLYARESELAQGFFTLRGGCRAGVCGRFTDPRDGHVDLADVGSVNVRIARQVRGAADSLMPHILEGKRPVSFLILSPPGMGKTTLLRDAVRQMSDGGVTVGLADERGEVAACVRGVPALDVGGQTDVIDGCPKARAIPMLVRTMSPQVAATDELGGRADADAVRYAARCGVCVAATAHADSLAQALCRPGVGQLIREGLFSRVVLLAFPTAPPVVLKPPYDDPAHASGHEHCESCGF